MLVEKIRRRMKGIIWFIVISFTLSIFFIGAASFLDNIQYREQQERQRMSQAQTEPQFDPEFNVMSEKPLAVVKMNGTSSTITEGQLNRMLVAYQMVERLRGLPQNYRSLMTEQYLQQLISSELMAIEGYTQNIDVTGKVTTRIGSLMSSNGGQERFTQQILRNGWSGIDELKSYMTKDYIVEEIKSKLFETVTVSDEDIESYYALYKNTKFKDDKGNVKSLADVKEEIRLLLSEKVSDEDLKAYYERHKERWRNPRVVDIQSLVISRSEPQGKTDLLEAIKEEELQKFYADNNQTYLAPEKADLRHLYIDKKELAKTIEIKEEEIADYYNSNSVEFTVEKMVQASHILVDTKARDDEEALKKAERVLAQLTKGEMTFEEAAKKHSDGPSGPNGGSLGSFRQGDMVPAFDAYCFDEKTEIGKVSAPIKTKFGYHLVRLEERMPAQVKALDEVRDRIVEDLQDKKVQEVANLRLDAAEAELNAQISNFEQVIAKYSVGLGSSSSQVLEDVFLGQGNDAELIKNLSTDGKDLDMPILVTLRTLKNGEVSEPVETAKGWHLMKLLNRKPPVVRPYDEVKEKVRTGLEELKLQELYSQRVTEVQTRILANEDFSSLVKLYSDSAPGRESEGRVKGLTLDLSTDLEGQDQWVIDDLGQGNSLNNRISVRLRYLATGVVSSGIDLGGRTAFVKVIGEEPVSHRSFDEVKDEVQQAITLKITDEEIVDYFNEKKAKFATPEEVLIEQIAYRTEEDAKMQLKSIQEGLMQFEAAGKSNLNVDRSNFEKNGGMHLLKDVGFDEEISTEIKGLEIGKLLPKLAKSPFGWHIVRLKDLKEAKEPNLDEARSLIITELKNSKRFEVIQAYAEELRNRAETIEIF